MVSYKHGKDVVMMNECKIKGVMDEDHVCACGQIGDHISKQAGLVDKLALIS